MIVYNITFKVRWSILDKWVTWQKEEHIPAHLKTGLFDEYKFFRLLEQDEDEGPTFVIQYSTGSEERYRQFMITSAPGLQQQAWNKWGDNFIAFRTVMSEETNLRKDNLSPPTIS